MCVWVRAIFSHSGIFISAALIKSTKHVELLHFDSLFMAFGLFRSLWKNSLRERRELWSLDLFGRFSENGITSRSRKTSISRMIVKFGKQLAAKMWTLSRNGPTTHLQHWNGFAVIQSLYSLFGTLERTFTPLWFKRSHRYSRCHTSFWINKERENTPPEKLA